MFHESDLNGQAGLIDFDESEWYDDEGQYHGPTNMQELRQITGQQIKEYFPMAPRVTQKKRKGNKPVLIKCGKHLVSPTDIRCISQVRKDLYIVKFFSDPNPEFPCWVEAADIKTLLAQFEIIVGD
jgi:hypothetical protein